MNTGENNPHLTAMIVSSYVRHHTVRENQLPDLITTVHRALDQLGQPVQPEVARTSAVSVRRSVQHDYVVCMDCGSKAVTLRRHLRIWHGLSPVEYLQRWGLKRDHPLTAPAYSVRRSALAKELGFGRKPSAGAPVVAPIPMAADGKSAATPARGQSRAGSKPAAGLNEVIAAAPAKRSPRSASKSAGVGDKAMAATPARKGRSRSRVA